MAWTTPRTWATNDLVDANMMNTHVRDNENYLYSGRPNEVVKLDHGASYTTTATSFAPVDATNHNFSFTVNITSGKALITFTGAETNNTSGGFTYFDVTVDGTRIGAAGADGLVFETNVSHNVSFAVLVTGLSAGDHIFNLVWKVQSGTTGTLYSGNGTAGQDFIPTFCVTEVG